jgi:hypothetical protein
VKKAEEGIIEEESSIIPPFEVNSKESRVAMQKKEQQDT